MASSRAWLTEDLMSSNDDSASTSSRYFGNTRPQTYYGGHTCYGSIDPRLYSPNSDLMSCFFEQSVDDYSLLPRISCFNFNEENTVATQLMCWPLMASIGVVQENINDERAEMDEKISDSERNKMLDCLGTSLRREVFDDCPDDVKEQTQNEQSDESGGNSEDQLTGYISDSSMEIELPTSSSSSEDEEEYMDGLRSSPRKYMKELNPRFQSARFVNGRVINVYSVASSSACHSSERLPRLTERNISVSSAPASVCPPSTVNGTGLNYNQKDDIMRQIVDFQSIVNGIQRELTQIQELLKDLYSTVDALQIHNC